ncbi:MAG: DUF1674 domain-containing protein [Proteobacteria bacterium]|nr:DUF1674 domain-containing protein [Pseudomonadota bacterium]
MTDKNKSDSTERPGTLKERTLDQEQAELTTEEYGGPKGPEPTRYGDWEKNGRCIDF